MSKEKSNQRVKISLSLLILGLIIYLLLPNFEQIDFNTKKYSKKKINSSSSIQNPKKKQLEIETIQNKQETKNPLLPTF